MKVFLYNVTGLENALKAIALELEHIARQLSIQNDITRATSPRPRAQQYLGPRDARDPR